MASLTLRHLKKVYLPEDRRRGLLPKKRKAEAPGPVTAVEDFSLSVADGEFVALVGPSGCGKTTTLRMIAGLEEPTAGEIEVDGRPMTWSEPQERNMAMVSQSYALYPNLTVYQNMAFPLEVRKTPRDRIDSIVREAAEILEITPYLARRPRALSGGQRQRVAIGRAIVRDPDFLLMDEPLSNLDQETRDQMRTELIRLRQRIHTTFLYVTHDYREAMTLGDRIVVMDAGQIRQVDTPQEIFDRPADRFVAGFMGSPQMNFFEGSRLELAEGRYAVQILGRKYILAGGQQEALRAAGRAPGPVTAGVRPVYLRLEEGGLPGRIVQSDTGGAELRLTVNIQGAAVVTAVLPTLELDLSELRPGAGVGISFPPERIHLFDPDTGKTLL